MRGVPGICFHGSRVQVHIILFIVIVVTNFDHEALAFAVASALTEREWSLGSAACLIVIEVGSDRTLAGEVGNWTWGCDRTGRVRAESHLRRCALSRERR